MIWWLVDNANLVYLLLAVVALVLAVLFWQNRRGKHLVALGGIVLLIGLLWLLSRLVITDRKQLELNLFAMADATLHHEPHKLRSYLAKDFSYGGLNRTEAAERVVNRAMDANVNDYHIWDYTVDELSRRDGKAKVSFRLRVNAPGDQIFMAIMRATFVLEANQWSLQRIDAFNAFANTDQPIQIPLHR